MSDQPGLTRQEIEDYRLHSSAEIPYEYFHQIICDMALASLYQQAEIARLQEQFDAIHQPTIKEIIGKATQTAGDMILRLQAELEERKKHTDCQRGECKHWDKLKAEISRLQPISSDAKRPLRPALHKDAPEPTANALLQYIMDMETYATSLESALSAKDSQAKKEGKP